MSNENSHSLKKMVQGISAQLQSMYPAGESRQLALMALEHVASISQQKIIMNDAAALSFDEKKALDGIVSRLLANEPIQYILGHAHFYGREFQVNPSVLIPRQETEELVKLVLSKVTGGMKLLDIGSGSGCISVTLAAERKDVEVTALDIDDEALKVTLENARIHGVSLKTIRADLLSMEHLPDTYNIIVSNPPYVMESEKVTMHQNVIHYEPHKALFVDDANPLVFYKQILSLAKQSLTIDGMVFFEINERFGREVMALCRVSGFGRVELIKDLEGKDRIILCKK